MRREFRSTSRWLPRIIAVLMAVALTTAVMHISMDRGRLAEGAYPRVDDVIYMARGAELWRAGHEGWERGGVVGAVKGVARDWKKDPPHAPWASGCAAMGFAVFGMKEWAAYVFTGLPVLAFVLAAGRIARRAGGRWGWRSAVLVGFAVSAPLLAASVQNLKPDYAAGIASAIGMMILLRGPLLTARWQRLAWAGVWFGLALLAKPAMLLATVMLLGGTLGACGLRDVVIAWRGVRRARWMWTIARGARTGMIVAGIAALIALPHYWFALGKVWAYSAGILEGDDWAYQGTLADRLLFYLTGPGGRLMLDGPRTLAPLVLLLACAGWVGGVARRGGSRRCAATLGAMLLVLGMAWAGPTVSRVLISQFAAAFDALLWLVAVYAAAMVFGGTRKRDRVRSRAVLPARVLAARVVAWMVVLGLMLTWRTTFPVPLQDRASPAAVRAMQKDRFLREVYGAIRAAAAGTPAATVLMAGSPSDLGAPLLTLWSIRDGQRWSVRELRRVPEIGARNSAQTPEMIAREFMERSDVVVVNEPGMGLSRPKDVTAGADAFYLAVARGCPFLKRAAQLADPFAEKYVEVYVKRVLDAGR